MKPSKVPQALKDRLAGQACTIQGWPAKIVGRLASFATVAALDPQGPTVEYAWETAARIIDEKGGCFEPVAKHIKRK